MYSLLLHQYYYRMLPQLIKSKVADDYLFFDLFFILFNFNIIIPAIAQRIEEKRY